MARRINEVQLVSMPIMGFIGGSHRMSFYGNPPLTFKIHIVQDLITSFSCRHRTSQLQETIGKGGFTVIDMGDDRKVANTGKIVHCKIKSIDFIRVLPSCQRMIPATTIPRFAEA